MQLHEALARVPEVVRNWLGRLTGRPMGVAKRAEARLRGKPYLALKSVSCSYRDGVLTLRGRVATRLLKQIAQAVASRVEGAERLEDEIEVVPRCLSRRWSPTAGTGHGLRR
jgi:osmotically-inducible protein OsmY